MASKIRNALKKGMDFAFGSTEHKDITIVKEQGDTGQGVLAKPYSSSQNLFEVEKDSETDLRVHYNSNFGFVNVYNGDTGDLIVRIDVASGKLIMGQDGTGIEVTSPDGSVTKEFGVLNDGSWGELP